MFYLFSIVAGDVVALFLMITLLIKFNNEGHTLSTSSGLQSRHEFKLRKDLFHVLTLTHNELQHNNVYYYPYRRSSVSGY